MFYKHLPKFHVNFSCLESVLVTVLFLLISWNGVRTYVCFLPRRMPASKYMGTVSPQLSWKYKLTLFSSGRSLRRSSPNLAPMHFVLMLFNIMISLKRRIIHDSSDKSSSWGGERGGSVVECRTPEREVRGSRPTSAVLCPWARHFTPRKYWLITQEAMAPSRHDWKIVDWDVKPQHNQPTPAGDSSLIKNYKRLGRPSIAH